MNNQNTANTTNVYDDGNIPEIDLPHGTQEFRQPKENWITTSPKSGSSDKKWITEPLPESTRPRQDGPGGEGL